MDQITQIILQASKDVARQHKEVSAGPKPSARDWSAFFASLGQLISVILPMILPLFLKEETV